MSEVVNVPCCDLQRAVDEIFVAAGVPADDARLIADHLVRADLRGVASHGVTRVGIYVHRFLAGLVARDRRPVIARETPVSALVDGNNASGIVVAQEAMAIAIDKARRSGVGVVGVRRSNHCGMLAYYTSQALPHGLLALATTNAPANMAPWGGRDRFFGTNPLSYAVPGGAEIDVVFDMASSQVARGKILLAEKEGRRIPVGWAMDPDGNDTTDPRAALAGVVLPLGGPKGYGIAFLVEVLSAIMTGADIGPKLAPLYDNDEREQNVGHFFLALSPDLFVAPKEFRSRIAETIAEIRRAPLAAGTDRIYIPGEIEQLEEERRRRDGIPLSREVLEELAGLARGLGTASAAELGWYAESGAPPG